MGADKGEFYRLLKQASKLPITSPPSPGTYLQAYREVSQAADAILCITVSSRVSSMFNTARLAKQLTEEMSPGLKIDVLDYQTAAMAQGFVVLAAAEASARGADLAEVTATAKSVSARVNLVAFLDTLYYLAKGGRIPRIAAWAGSLLSLKPIMEFRQGEVKLLERARTTSRAAERLVTIMRRRVEGERPLYVAVLHADAPEEAGRLAKRVSSQFNCAELYVTEFTPAMGTHTGPGLLGLAFYI